MAMQERSVAVPLDGMDTSADPKLPAGQMLLCENGRRRRRNAIDKRHGLKRVTGGGYSDRFLAAYKGRPVLYEEGVSVFDGDDATSGQFLELGDIKLVDVETDKLLSANGGAVAYVDVAENSTVRAVTSLRGVYGGNELVLETFCVVSGVLIEQTVLDTNTFGASNARMLVVSDEIWVVYGTGGNQIRWRVIASDGTVGSPTTYVSAYDHHDEGTIDACLFSTGVDILVSYKDYTTSQLALLKIDASVPSGGSHAAALVSASNMMDTACFPLDDDVVVCWIEGGADIKAVAVDTSLTTTVSSSVVKTASPSGIDNLAGIQTSPTTADILYSWETGSTPSTTVLRTNKVQITNDETGPPSDWSAGGGEEVVKNLWLHSKPFADSDGSYYFWGAFYSNDLGWVTPEEERSHQKTLMLCTSAGRVVGRALLKIAESAWPRGLPTTPFSTGTDTWVVAASYRLDEASIAAAVVNFTMGAGVQQPQAREINERLVIPSSVVWEFDGRNVVEHGFHAYPENCTASSWVAGSTVLEEKTYSWRFTRKWFDSKGYRHRSAPSPATEEVVIATNERVDVRCPVMALTDKTGVMIEIWRTLGDEDVYFKVAEVAEPTAAGTGWVQYTDGELAGQADDEISKNERLYTTGGVVENVAPPLARVACVHQDRLCFVDDEDRTLVRLSKAKNPREGTAHSDFLTIRFPDGEDLIALESLDDKLVAFTANRVYAVTGSPPSDILTGGGFSTPFLVNNAVGCRNARSIVRVPGGIVFQDAGGFSTLTGALQVVPIGEPTAFFAQAGSMGQPMRYYTQVEAWNIVAAVLLPEAGEVVWLTDDADGRAIVYNYRWKFWSLWTGHQASSGCAGFDRLFVRTNEFSDLVLVEDRTTYRDYSAEGNDTAYVSLLVDLGWLSFFGKGGDGRVRRAKLIADAIDAHNLVFDVGYNFDPAWNAAGAPLWNSGDHRIYESSGVDRYWSESAQMAMAGDMRDRSKAYLLKVAVARQRCTAVRMRFYDTKPAFEPAGYCGQGYSLNAVIFDVAAESSRSVRLDQARSV